MDQENTNYFNIGKSLVLTITGVGFVIGLAVIAFWSFMQTVDFYSAGMSASREITVALGLVTQFGQNFCLFKAHNARTPNAKLMWIVAFGALALIDAGTNVGQWRAEYPAVVKEAGILSIVMHMICIGVVFVEEIIADSVEWTLHNVNELWQALGGNPVPGLAVAASIAGDMSFSGASRRQRAQGQ